MLVVGVRREQRRRPLLADHVGAEHPVDLVLHVAAQVPRHRLQPGERVHRRPLVRVVVETARVEHGVLQRDLRRRAVRQVGVDAVGVRVEGGAGVAAAAAAARARRRRASPSCARTCRSRGRPRRTSRPAGRRSRAGARPSRRSAPARARSPARASGRGSSRRRSAGCRARRGSPRPRRPGRGSRRCRRSAGTTAGPARRRRAAGRSAPGPGRWRCTSSPAAASAGARNPRSPSPAPLRRVRCHGADIVHVAYHLAVDTGECQEHHADLPVRMHRVRTRLRAVPELLGRLADRVPGVLRAAAQAVQRGRRRLQGLGLLPHRQPLRDSSESTSESKSETKTETKTETKSDTKSETKSEKKSDSKPAPPPPTAVSLEPLWRAGSAPRVLA